ncbi:MAG: hypothetical protein JO087_12460 [Actinobacteria bacterium]|nr:hypothetical protein [Actinomycetota bacterium]
MSGRIAPGFPMTVQTVKLLEGSHVIASARVAVDGRFRLWTLPKRGLTLHLVGAGRSTVVFPRQASGGVDRTFSIVGAGVDFDLGAIRYVGTAGTFAFHTTGDGACNADGQDANGAECVDDANNNDSGSCGNNDGEQQDGSDSSDGAADSQDGQDQGDAVAEHNFPSDGCADGNDNGGDPQDGEGGD